MSSLPPPEATGTPADHDCLAAPVDRVAPRLSFPAVGIETSKEELQSLNADLTTVNAQLQTRKEELEATTNELGGLLTSTNLAVIFLDGNLHIRRFTPAVKDLVDLVPADVGRPLSDLASKFGDEKLLEDVARVLDTLATREAEVVSTTGRVYVRRAQPCRICENRIQGVVVTFVDITQARANLLANISHELRTPLGAMLLWAKLLSEPQDLDPQQLQEGLLAIKQCAEEQQALIENLVKTVRSK